MKKVIEIITPLGSFRGKEQEVSVEEFKRVVEKFKENINEVAYLQLEQANGDIVLMPKEVCKNSVVHVHVTG